MGQESWSQPTPKITLIVVRPKSALPGTAGSLKAPSTSATLSSGTSGRTISALASPSRTCRRSTAPLGAWPLTVGTRGLLRSRNRKVSPSKIVSCFGPICLPSKSWAAPVLATPSRAIWESWESSGTLTEAQLRARDWTTRICARWWACSTMRAPRRSCGTMWQRVVSVQGSRATEWTAQMLISWPETRSFLRWLATGSTHRTWAGRLARSCQACRHGRSTSTQCTAKSRTCRCLRSADCAPRTPAPEFTLS
mmetsp:Transcript_48250/g.114329  ORF Transcript_48250/g.114329 Transcript_48250/m.114329 type:complete len:252 (+) Transcript_48250:1153-1908(+)